MTNSTNMRINRPLASLLAAMSCLLAAAVLPATGCTKKEVAGKECVGGVVDSDGGCQPKCVSKNCKAGNVCVDNECKLECQAHSECFDEVQSCAEAKEDSTGRALRVCTSTGRARVRLIGAGSSCAVSGDECGYQYCGAEHGFARCDLGACGGDPTKCVPLADDPVIGTCSDSQEGCLVTPCDLGECKATLYCPNGLQCDPSACGGDPTQCERDDKACPPGDGSCNIGRCVGSGDTCIFDTCPVAHCKSMRCSTLGEGDANAYCFVDDCADDKACAPGYFCRQTNDPHDICGATCNGTTCVGGGRDGLDCNGDGDCQRGNNATCGTTEEACVDISPAGTINDTTGATFQLGASCLQRQSCVKRDGCAPCESTLDCELGNGDLCAVYTDGPTCLRLCSDHTDCSSDHFCVSYLGLTGANSTCEKAPMVDCKDPATDCPDPADVCTPRNICIPLSGACRAVNAESPDKFCHHCLEDKDCGDPAEGWGCIETQGGPGTLASQKGCFNLNFPSACTTNADCPKAPGGAFAECLNEDDGAQPGSSVYHRCYLPQNSVSNRFSCFP